MKSICILKITLLSLIYFFPFSTILEGQQLGYKAGKFILNDQIHPINEIQHVLDFDYEHEALYNKIVTIDESRKVWQFITITGCAFTGLGIAGLSYFSQTQSALIYTLGTISSGALLIVAIPSTLIAGSGWTIAHISRNKRAKYFIDSYNNTNPEFSESHLKLQITQFGLGLTYTF